ncbi:MAG TPA: alpha/beta hydrolase-fold protein [Mycobacteriales bacterium]|nr:alpha/beta hydrolase-fold protein [Mycobacteriales bacterium]
MRRLPSASLCSALLLVAALPAAHAAPRSGTAMAVATVAKPADLPDDGPPALYRAEPALPTPTGWPGTNAFPRTSGTGRLSGGGLFWSDWIYDDHGGVGAGAGTPAVLAGTPAFGTYTYPDGAAHANGADITRAAVVLRAGATYWRVDWETLADPTVPLAEWTFDTDDDSATGASAWPAGASVRSPGIEEALVVGAHGAQLIDVVHGTVIAHLPVSVDRAAQSFVVAVPTSVLPVSGTWRIRLGAGLADAGGTAFAAPSDALPGEARLYNVTFRDITQEPQVDTFWDDRAQSVALTLGDVSAFSHTVTWSDLAARRTTAEARPYGWSDRWYVSAVDLGPGIVTPVDSTTDDQPNFLGRVQPYAVYVPRSYTGSRPAPMTFLLHSSNQNHNQYAATTVHLVQGACEDRDTICVSPFGRGPDGDYWDTAELDFWQVWHAVAGAYTLDPERTILAGYSMGGVGANSLAMEHPDLYARAITLAGGVGNVPEARNLRWVPTYLAGGAADELVPINLELGEAKALDALGLRYRWIVVATEHVSYELLDSFNDAIGYMGFQSKRVRWPGHVTFTWAPTDTAPDDTPGVVGIPTTQRADLGVGTTGAYWLRSLVARSSTVRAAVDATSQARPDAAETVTRTHEVSTTVGPTPAVVSQLAWTPGATPAKHPVITVHLTNVGAVTVLLVGAGIAHGKRATVTVTTDGPTTLHIGAKTWRLTAGAHTVHPRA